MCIKILTIFAWLVSKCPDWVLEKCSWCLGRGIYYMFFNRKKILLNNLKYAFPHNKEDWHKKIAKESCKRMVEMSILSLIQYFWTEEEIKKRFKLSTEARCFIEAYCKHKQSLLILMPHFSTMQATTCIPVLYGKKSDSIGVIYRPLNNQALEVFIKKTREQSGIKMLSRKSGLIEAMHILKKKGVVGILFDQNAGVNGLETLFMDRPVYATELPGLMAEKYAPQVLVVYMQREGFGKGTIVYTLLKDAIDKDSTLLAANDCLEKLLKSSDNLCADWLWLHNRWDMKKPFTERLSSSVKKTIMPETLNYKKLVDIPKKTNIYIRLPNWLGDVVMALPLIRALQKSRPDAYITLIGKKSFHILIQSLGIADNFIQLPEKKGLAYWKFFWQLRKEKPAIQLLFTNSMRGDLEAFLIGAQERFGIQKNTPRPLLTHTWEKPHLLKEVDTHQVTLWSEFLKYFGLNTAICLDPFAFNKTHTLNLTIGLICGTENSPEKRWPIEYWRTLIQAIQKSYPNAFIKLFGTPKDAIITQQVAHEFKNTLDLAGKTDTLSFLKELSSCRLVIGNDTGGLHLANMVGVPIIGLFGPTNPIRTGPIYKAQKHFLQPKNCPPTGGAIMHDITPTMVLDVLKTII